MLMLEVVLGVEHRASAAECRQQLEQAPALRTWAAGLATGGLLTTVAGTGAAAGRRRRRQAAAPAGLVGAWSTTPASSAPARPRGSARPAPGAAPAATPRCRACQQKLKAQHTRVQWRRIARSLRTWKSAQPSSPLTCL